MKLMIIWGESWNIFNDITLSIKCVLNLLITPGNAKKTRAAHWSGLQGSRISSFIMQFPFSEYHFWPLISDHLLLWVYNHLHGNSRILRRYQMLKGIPFYPSGQQGHLNPKAFKRPHATEWGQVSTESKK